MEDMKTVKAKVTFEYDFSEQIGIVNEEREREGEPPMTEEEIYAWVKEDLADFDFRETVEELPLEISVSNAIPCEAEERGSAQGMVKRGGS
jgi:hypothetical protein